ncbi:MAG: serine/threonine-protein kinase [Planctomycetota bacterium]
MTGSTPDERWTRVRNLFERACALEEPERDDLLAEEEPEVRSEVMRLLDLDAQASTSLERVAADAIAETSWAATLAPGQRVGPYRLVRVLGSGGMGVVFEAEEESPHRRVALKTLRAEAYTPELLGRFANEVQLLARLEHPGIARVFASGTFERAERECPYYTMELVEDARTLLGYADHEGLDLRARLELLLQALSAVEHGHRKGVIHRDLKPGNLLVDPGGHVKVIDFGLARPSDPLALGAVPLQTEAGQVLGTLAYMSPEHVGGRPGEVDTQSDVYSLGCILCELLSGRPPHELAELPLRAALERIEGEDPRPPAELPAELRWVIARACARERARRYAGVAELSEDLRRYLRREPVQAAPPSRIYALRTLARRHRGLLAGVGAVVVALGIGLAQARSEARVAREARAEAELEAAVANEVSGFLADLFTGMNAYSNGAEARVSEVLKVAAERLPDVAREDARVILSALVGQGYLNLGDLASAEPYLSEAFERGAELFAGDSVHRLRNEILWADWLEQTGRYAESRELTIDLLARGASVLERRDLFYARYNLAVCDSRLGNHVDAEEVFRGLLKREMEAKESWTRVINLTHRLASEISFQDRTEEARTVFREALDQCGRMPGNELYAATIQMDLAHVQRRLGELDDAQRLLDLAGTAFERHDAPVSNRILCELGRAAVQLDFDDVDAAGEALEQAFVLLEQVHGTTRMHVHVGLVDAQVLAAEGDAQGAREAAEEALSLALELAGEGSPLVAEARDVLGRLESD